MGVDSLEKHRVYELAKELNTTSKRLMEKLTEINVEVKNHMSLLNDDELASLYKHIGVIKHEEGKKVETEEKEKKPSHSMPSSNDDSNKEVKKEVKKSIKSAPRIIRKTEIIIDTKNETKEAASSGYYDSPKSPFSGDVRGENTINHKRDFVKAADSNSGLRAGYIRDTKPAYSKEQKPLVKDEAKKDIIKEDITNRNKSMNAEKADSEKDEKKGIAADNNKQTEQNRNSVQDAASSASNLTIPEIIKHEEKHTVSGNSEAPKNSNFQRSSSSGYNQRPSSGQNSRPYNNQSNRPYNSPSNRPSSGQNSRPYSGTNNSSNSRPYSGTGDRINNNSGFSRGPNDRTRTGGFDNRSGARPGGDRFQNSSRPANKPLEIPKIEFTPAQKEEVNSIKAETRREFQSRDFERDAKRDQKREIPKGQAVSKEKKLNPATSILGQKKGVSEVLSEDFILNTFYSDNEIKKNKKGFRTRKDTHRPVVNKYIPPRAVLTNIKIHENIIVKDLAEALKKTSTEVIKKLMGLGVMATVNHELDFDTAYLVAEEFGVKAEKELVINEEDILFDDSDENEENLVSRPPVVVVMGHVDHGKTSLLDAIRETNVIESEAGGITQHIGAYMVKINNRNITFLDTPGHEAFTAMRARGAQATDIAILVVAADDGIMPQTIEAIDHAKAAKITIIVAINKIDKIGADTEKVKQELTEHGLVAEEWGGDTIFVPVSAKKRENIDHLLEMVLLAADMLELKTNPDKQAKGTIIEAKLDKGRGPVATVLVQRGTLNTGDSIVTGSSVGRIRAMVDDKGHKLKKAGPSTPVEILGLPEVPVAGEVFYAITDEKIAKQLAEKRKTKHREEHLKSSAKISLDDLYSQIKEGKVKDLNLIIKADVQGSVEAVKQSLDKLSNEEVRVNIIHGGVGGVTESDVTLAQVSNAIIIGFNVRPSTNVAEAAQNAGVDLRLYRVIYNAIDDIRAAMNGMLEPTFKEVIQGHTEIRQIFKVSGIGTIGGCYVTDGKIVRNSDVRVVRNEIVVHEGKLASLKRFKDDVKEAVQGYECGLSIERFNDIKEGDIVESFVMEEVARQLKGN